MSNFEVSQEEWVEVMGNNPSYFYALNQEINAPVENIDWYDCIEYCNRLSVMQGLTPCYSINGETNYTAWPADWHPAYPDTSAYQNQIACNFDANGYRMPTETEWEYAAKAGTNSLYSGTDNIANLVDYAWYGASTYQTHIIGLKQPNAWGLYDMTGNVWEWCWNAYRFYPGNTSYMNAENRSLRMARGGAWNSLTLTYRTTYRNALIPSLKTFVHGLRIVKKA
jgi:formylglycine-generating enzyme